MSTIKACLLGLILALSCTCVAQVYVEGRGAVTGGLGYFNPELGASVGVEGLSVHRWSDTSAGWTWARKIETGDGHQWVAGTQQYWRRNALLLGGGAQWTREVTSAWAKSAWRVGPGIGWEGSESRAVFQYEMPWFDSQNGAQGPGVTWELRTHSRVRLVTRYQVWRYLDTRVAGQTYTMPARVHWGADVGIGIRIAIN